MSADSRPQPAPEDEYEEDGAEPAEIVDALPVLVEAGEVQSPQRSQGAVLVQTAAVAATSFVAGAATAAVLGRRLQNQLSRSSRGAAAPEVLSTRTFLVSVHLLGRRED